MKTGFWNFSIVILYYYENTVIYQIKVWFNHTLRIWYKNSLTNISLSKKSNTFSTKWSKIFMKTVT